MSTVRLYIDTPLAAQAEIVLARDHAHYLFTVMRLAVGEAVLVFNGRDGEWQAEIAHAGKKNGVLRALHQTRPQTAPPDIELLFAPIKKARTDFIVEKACELGCRRVRPVFTRRTNSERLNLTRLHAHMIEAAEQCDGLSIPTLESPDKLQAILGDWPDRLLVFCDEARNAPEISEALSTVPRGTPASVLIGPEGGFSPDEAALIQSVKSAVPVSLGPRILRADTAAIAALTAVQSALGDWRTTNPGTSTPC